MLNSGIGFLVSQQKELRFLCGASAAHFLFNHFYLRRRKMANCKYPGFNKLEENSPLFLSLPLCDLLRELIGKRDYAYIASALYPLELTELILHYLKYDRGIDDGGEFAQKYLTEDSLCPIDKLIELWGMEKFNQMIEDLQILAKI